MTEQPKQNILIGSLSFSVLLASVGTSMANLALPAISLDYDISFSRVRWVVLSYLLTSTLFSLVMGLLGDLKGRRQILLAGTVLFAVGTFVSGYSWSFWILISARVIQGIGAAALVVLPIAIVTEAMPPKKTGRAIGLLATMSAVGTASGPSIGGFILGEYGWRSAFYLMTIFGSLNFYLLFRFVRFNEASRSESRGSAYLPKVAKSIYCDSSLRTQLFSNFIISAVMMSTLIVGPYFLTHGLHLEPIRMGLVMSAGPVTSVFSGIFSGFAVDRFGSRSVINLGFIILLIGTISFVLAPSQFGAVGFLLSAVLLSLGYQLFLSANSNSIMKDVNSSRRGLVSGALSLSRNLGLIGGTLVMGSVFDFFAKASSPSHASSKTISNGFQATFLLAAILIAYLLINHLKNEKEKRWNKIH